MDGKENGGCFAVEEGVKYDDARKVPDFSEAELEAAIEVRRPVFRTQQFREKYLKASPPGRSFKEQIQGYLRSACHCSSERCRKFCCGIFPCIRIVRKYKWQSDLPSDVIAGLTVGIMQLPQGMAYALLAELPPVVGLYVSFFPILMYFLFGTSRQIAMGTVAVVSLMVGTVVSRTTESSSLSAPLNSTYMTANSSDGHSVDLDAEKIKVAACLAFMVGIAQLVMGFLQLGFITTFMSDSLVSGFTTGAAVHVFTSQVKYVLGLHPKRFGGIFQIVFTYSEIIKNISHTNLVELLISSICIVVLYVFKVQINQRFKARMKVPIPIELFVVVIGTVASHYGHFREKYRIRIVGEIPAGLPKPIFPDLNKAGNYIADVIPLAIVAFAQSVSLAALMAKKHNYDIDSNKELFAYGVGNLFGSFFSCYPFAASVSRTSVLDSAGGKTQIASLISCFLVLIVILAIGPLFKSLPNCILSAIIMVALRTMLLQVLELKNLWRVSRYDFAIWSVTFIGAVVLHVDFGLGIGIAFSIFTVVLRTQRTKACVMGKIGETDIFQNECKYEKSGHYSGMKVIAYEAPVYYANAEIFVKQVYHLSGVKPEKLRKALKKRSEGKIIAKQLTASKDEVEGSVTLKTVRQYEQCGKASSVMSIVQDSSVDSVSMIGRATSDLCPIHHVIIDCSSMNFIDIVGLKTFKQLYQEYDGVNIRIFFAGVKDKVLCTMESTGFLEKYAHSIYLTVHDAVIAATTTPSSLLTSQETIYI